MPGTWFGWLAFGFFVGIGWSFGSVVGGMAIEVVKGALKK